MKYCNEWDHIENPFLLKEISIGYHILGIAYNEILTKKEEEKELIKIYKDKLKPLVPIPIPKEKNPKANKWEGYHKIRQIEIRQRPSDRMKLNKIVKIRRDLDAYITKYQSKKLLQLYLLAEKIEKAMNGGKLEPPKERRKNLNNSNAISLGTAWGENLRMLIEE